MDPEVRQRQFFAFVRRLVQARSAQEPTVIFMDDLHWIDAASDELLAQLVEAVPATPTLLLVNFRPEYAAEWTRKSYYEQLPLMPLGAGDVEAMLRELLGSDESVERLSAVIRERTAGNPFFMEELVRSLVEAGVLEGERGAYRRVRVVEDLEVPATVQAVLAARIDRLPEREKRALQTAAIIGQQFTVPLLSAVTELANSDLTAALSALESAEFIFPRSLYPVAEYVFKHPLMEQVARESQLAERRRQLHRAVGRRIEELHADRLPDSWEALAHHFYRGQDWSPAFEYLRKTGDKARAAFANREAVSLYDRAAEAADHLELEAAERAALYEAKGQAHLGLSEFPEAVEAFRRALDLSTVERDRARLQVALATALTWVYEFDAAIAAAEEALAISRAEGDPGTAGIASLIIARVRAIRGDLDGAERSHIDAARFAEASGRNVLATQLHVSEALAANWRGSYRAGIELLEPIVGRAEKENELMVLLEAKSHLAITLGGAGEYGRAISLISDGVALAESIGDKVWRARMWNTRGWILNELGAFEEAEEANVRCLETAQQLSVRIGMFDELTANAEANLADGALWRGDAGAAEPHLAGVAAIANKPRNEWMVWRFGMHCQATACELALDRGDLARARDHLAICLRTARRTRSRRYLVRAIRLLAACHVFAGDFAKAEPLISAAVRRARELGNPPQRWHALLAQGHGRRSAGPPSGRPWRSSAREEMRPGAGATCWDRTTADGRPRSVDPTPGSSTLREEPIVDYETILYQLEDHIVTITLNRPERRNCINQQMNLELQDAFKRFRDDKEALVAILLLWLHEARRHLQADRRRRERLRRGSGHGDRDAGRHPHRGRERRVRRARAALEHRVGRRAGRPPAADRGPGPRHGAAHHGPRHRRARGPLEERLRIETEMMMSMWLRKDRHSAGAQAFLDKNLKPEWPNHGL
jgi:tetratricopeptide (TPR) repeat protein